MTELEAGLRHVLFAAGDAVPVDRLAAALEAPRGAVLEAAAARKTYMILKTGSDAVPAGGHATALFASAVCGRGPSGDRIAQAAVPVSGRAGGADDRRVRQR